MCRLPLENGPRVPLSRPAAQSQRTQQYDDEFLQYTYKVVPCDKAWRHDYASCPFAHAGESSERRHPSAYLPFMCNSTQHSTDLKEKCPFGTSCKYAHGHFELWLHPGRFRTKLCSLGENCRRPVCFFAHSEQELRVTPYSKLDTSASVAAQQLGETQADAAPMAASSGRSSSDGSDIKSAACSTASPYGSEASHPLLERPGGSPSCHSDAACDDSFAAFSAAMALKSQAAVLQQQQQQQSPYSLADTSLVGSSQAPALWLANSGAMLQQPCLAAAMQPAYGSLLPQQQQQLMMDSAATAGLLAGLTAPGAGMGGADLMGSWMMAQSAAAANALPEQWPASGLMPVSQHAPLPYPGTVQMQCLPLPRLLQPSGLDQWLAAEATTFPPGLAAPQPSADPRVVQLLSTLPDNTVQQLLHALG